MKVNSQPTLALVALMSMFGLFASDVVADTIGASVGVSTISPCPSFCGGSGGSSEFASAGGAGFNTASASLNNPDGNGQGYVNLNGPTYLPILGAEAFSGTNSRVSVGATGQQLFTYSGSIPTSITLDLDFDGEASAPVSSDASAVASIVVVRGNDMPFFTDFSTLVFEVIPGEFGLEELGRTQVSLPVNTGQQTVQASVPFSLSPGDEFFVWANVSVRGTRGGSVDALNTLSVQFSDPTGIAPVPEPASAFLAMLGLLGLVCHRRCSIVR